VGRLQAPLSSFKQMFSCKHCHVLRAQAVAAAASELMQLAGAAAILWGACQRYQPLPQPW